MTELEQDMKIEWDVDVPMKDGVVLKADVFRPTTPGKYPVILSYGPYAKGLDFAEGFEGGWKRLIEQYPEVVTNTSAKYANFEVVDPEKWVPDGYICVRVDARGAGRSPGCLNPKSIKETEDLYECIEWAAVQDWSNGKVGLNGISYYATNQWYVASMQPPHLSAICAWEGATDYYRENTHHGGILCGFLFKLYPWAVWRVQYGLGDKTFKNRVTGVSVSGGPELPEAERIANRIDIEKSLRAHPMDDEYYRDRSAKWDKINVPMLSAANWGGQGLHPRGNFEGFVRAASKQKWLEVHGMSHWTHFYTEYGVNLQKKFFGHFLKGENNGWDKQPPVQLNVRHVDRFELRHENEWPLARTQWTKLFLLPQKHSLDTTSSKATQVLDYDPMGDGITFRTAPFDIETEITGPVAAKLFVSSKSDDADIFLALRLFDPNGKEVTFQGSNDPHTPIGLGWLRASHRKLDTALTKPYRPYHTHDERQPLQPGMPVELDVEIWPTCIVVQKGYTLALTVRGNDYRYDGPVVRIPGIGYDMAGVGPFVHNDPVDRPNEIFGATVSLHFDEAHAPYLLLPVIPAK